MVVQDTGTTSPTPWAHPAGAFDDVVSDLLTLLETRPELADQDPSLPAGPVSPSVVEVEDFSMVNDALGVLIHRGYSLTEARADLQDRGAQGHSGLPSAARDLLDDSRPDADHVPAA